MQTNQKIIKSATRLIFNSFKDYLAAFRLITRAAKPRFEQRDWHGVHRAGRRRLKLYKDKVQELSQQLKTKMESDAEEVTIWQAIKQAYYQEIRQRKDAEIAETFYNSICRKVFTQIGTNPDIMFTYSVDSEKQIPVAKDIFRTYLGKQNAVEIVRQILIDYAFNVPYENLERDIKFVTDAINKQILTKYKPDKRTKVEVLKSIFYRNKGAYLVGRVHIAGQLIPFLLPLLHEKKGIFVDTLITKPNDVSIIFSFTRSYFFVEVDVPIAMVRFIQSLTPQKHAYEIYNSIGFNKHGKTVFYRNLMTHLQQSNDRFIIAPGIKGMVMSVFTLPSYPVVFKLIKDKFDPPKSMTRQQVKDKYKLVSRHDRVGRMADTHEFENFAFDKSRFTPELLEELQKVVPSLLKSEENKLIIKHLYTERKMIPLNIYLENTTPTHAEEVVDEYGNAIKQLAAANIFPGDMLLKNFGVTRHRRVVFYDYDEICFLTDCNFRRIPEPRDYYEEYASEAWYSVGPNDIFPEEFRKFLIGHRHIRQLFYRLHNDIFDTKFWKGMQKRLNAGEVADFFPYRRRKRFRNI